MKNKNIRFAVFVDGDLTWSLPSIEQSLKFLTIHYDLQGIWQFDNKLVNHKGINIPLWYLSTFGIIDFIFLALFSLKIRISRLIKGKPLFFQRLAHNYRVPYFRASSPNQAEVTTWVKDNDVDVILILVGQILKREIISAPKIGIINKHSSLLPSCRGILPYFWSTLNGIPAGISFHTIDEGIDTGEILVQRKYITNKIHEPSMLHFYIDVFAAYPELINLAFNRLVKGEKEATLAQEHDSYYSLPTRQIVTRFRKLGKKIVHPTDLIYFGDSKLFVEM